MIRTVLILLVACGGSVLAWRDWFKALCLLVAFIALDAHADMPRSMLGIPGLNPWNLLFLNVLGSWALHRGREGHRFDPPPATALLAFAYFSVMLVAFVRLFIDDTFIELFGWKRADLINDMMFNTIKYVVPGILLFDGARSPERKTLAVLSIASIYVVLAIQVVNYVPFGALGNAADLQRVASRIIQNEVGYSRVNMSMMLAGGAWAVLAVRDIVKSRWLRLALVGAFGFVTFAQALTGGRMGYVTWAVLCLVMGAIRWRLQVLIAPLVVAAVISVVPAVRDRMLTGFGDEEMGEARNESAMTSDRSEIWPAVISKIRERPVEGYGHLAMLRTGLSTEFSQLEFPHPHNAYLEVLLDAGYIGFFPVVLFFVAALFHSFRLFAMSTQPLYRTIGGISVALTLALLVASFGSQHFMPQQGGFGMWAAIGLAVRTSLDRSREIARARVRQRFERISTVRKGAVDLPVNPKAS